MLSFKWDLIWKEGINLTNHDEPDKPCHPMFKKLFCFFFFFQIIMFHQSCCQISRLFYLHVSAVDEITGHWQVARSGSVDGGFCLWATIREPHCTSCKGNFMKTFRYESGICKGLQEHVTSTCKMMERLNVILRSMWKKKKLSKLSLEKGKRANFSLSIILLGMTSLGTNLGHSVYTVLGIDEEHIPFLPMHFSLLQL